MCDVNGADAVNEGVVGLRAESPPAVGQSFEEHHVPERAVALESARPVLAGPFDELAATAWSRQGGPAYVVLDREARIGLPVGPAEPAGVLVREAGAVVRKQVDPVFDLAPKLAN